MIAICVTYAAWECLFRYQVRVPGVRMGRDKSCTERWVRKEKDATCHSWSAASDKELGTGKTAETSAG